MSSLKRWGLEMITHVVLLQPKDSTSNTELTAFFEQVQALQQTIPGIVALSVGENRSMYHGGFTHGIIMRFIDEAHLKAHHEHPAHVAIVTELGHLCKQSIDFDLPEPKLLSRGSKGPARPLSGARGRASGGCNSGSPLISPAQPP